MSKEVTRGRLERYQRRYDSFGWQKSRPPLNLFGLGRRAQLKALRNAMSLTRNQLRRMSRRWKPY